MPEIPSSEPHGHLKLGTQDLRQNLYRIFCYFFASESLLKCSNEDIGQSFVELREHLEETEIQSALIAVAVRLRIIEQTYRNIFEMEDFGIATGNLQPDINSAKEKPLSLRDACNIIVHAEKFQFDRTYLSDEGEFGSLNPWVFIYGNQFNFKKKIRENWKAKLEIQPFVNLGVFACSGLDSAKHLAK